jgi:hypothetical protein
MTRFQEQYDFSIRIEEPRSSSDNNYSFVDKVYDLVENADRKYSFKEERHKNGPSPLHDYLVRRLKYHFLSFPEAKPILFEYSETKGSLIITFSVLLFGLATNYEQYINSIDAFTNDIERLIGIAFPTTAHYTTRGRLSEGYNNQSIPVPPSIFNKPIAKKAAYVIVFFLSIAGIFDDELLRRHVTENEGSNAAIVQELVLENKIRNQIILEMAHDQLLIHRPELERDSIFSNIARHLKK